MEIPPEKLNQRYLEHLEVVYRELIVELIHQAGKDWYPQTPELFRCNQRDGVQISYEDAVLLQWRTGNTKLLNIEASVMGQLMLPSETYQSLHPLLRKKVSNKDELSQLSPQEFGVVLN